MKSLPARWAQTTVGTVCRLTNGMVFRPSDWSPSGVPIVRIQNLNSKAIPFNYFDGSVEPRFRIKAGDLLFAWSGTPGTSFGAHLWDGPDAVLNQHIFKVSFDTDAIDPVFLRDAINETLDEQEANSHGGVGLRHVTKQAFSNTRLPFPPRREQTRIAERLSRLRARVTALDEALADSLKQAAPARLAVLEAAFDGELTKAWRARQASSESVTALLARVSEPQQSRGGRAATARMIPGRAGISVNVPPVSLPPGWQWVSLHRLARQETGHTPSRRNPEYWGGSVPWLGIRDASAHHGERVASTAQTITAAGLENSSARVLPAETVCLSRTASVGYVTILGVEMATSQDFATWTCGLALLPDYLMYALLSEGPEIRRFGEGTVHTTIYFPEIRAFHIRLAPIEEQVEIVRAVRTAFRRIDQLVEAARTAAGLSQALLRDISTLAFAGHLTTREKGDGFASAELERVRVPEPEKSIAGVTGLSSRRAKTMIKSIEMVLKEADDWLPAQEVFRRCGVGNGAETETLEGLYAELRALSRTGRLLAEPILDDAGRKVQDRLQLTR